VVIVAAGLSPAWQQILQFDAFMPGEVNRARVAHWCGSGKVLNVGLGLASLGAESCTIAPLGGPARYAIEQEFVELEAPLRVIPCREATRICTTILDRASGMTTELVENARPLAVEEVEAYAEVFAAEAAGAGVIVLTGSLPSGVTAAFYSQLLDGTSARAILDVRGPELQAALAHRPLVVKPNREELGHTVGRKLRSDAELLAAMREMNQAGAQWVVVTAGKEALLVSSSQEAFRVLPLKVDSAVNPIGCGDALAAGVAVAIERGESVVEAVRYGVAAAADRLRLLLPGRMDPARVAQLAERISIERL